MAPGNKTHPSSSSTKKRKINQPDGPPSGTSTGKQPAISHHFSTDDPRGYCPDTSRAPASPTGKRRKLAHSSDGHRLASSMTSTDDMYSFAGAGTNGNNHIDLTDSPTSSPKPRKSGGTPTKVDKSTDSGFGAKKLVVKNLRKTNRSDSSSYCSTTIKALDAALTAIFGDRRPELSNEELYRGVENVCKLGKAEELAELLNRRMRTHLQMNFKEPLLAKTGETDIVVLRAVIPAWTRWNNHLVTIRSIFFYLDRSHLVQTSSGSLYDTSIGNFRRLIVEDKVLVEKVINGTYALLLADRNRTNPQPELFKDAVAMFHALSIYSSHFEPKMLNYSQKYILEWADYQCGEKELPEYVSACNDFIEKERVRCKIFNLDDKTSRELLQLLEANLIERKQDDLTDHNAVADLLDHEALDKLATLFTLLQRKRLGSNLKGAFSSWIDSTGTAIVFDEQEQDSMVVRLLELKHKLDHIWRTSFQKNKTLGHALRESFETFVNKSKKSDATWGTDNSKPGEMIAKYVDQLLRGGAKAIPKELSTSTGGTKPFVGLGKQNTAADAAEDDNEEERELDEDAEVNKQLDQVLDLFRFIHGKAVFEAFYKNDLARRLLMGRSASNDAEKSMLERLKNECGHAFTQNLEQMFRDVELARDEMAAFKELASSKESRNLDLSVNILSSAAWPSYPDVPVIIPPEVKKATDIFEAFYYSKHSGRKLHWKHSLAHCQLKAWFPKGTKEIIVSSFQAIVLLLFNGVKDDENVTYDRIKAESGLSDPDLHRTLQSLACAKLRPLTKHPKGKDINPTDTFSLNTTFTHERYRFKINAIQMKETAQENKATHERVAADRQYETQAAIVRIMKGKKKIGHAQLIAETIKETKSRGTLQPAEIKKNIERLIDKEYLERLGAEEGGGYGYVA
ncbi:MAG: hypothetical protein M1831_004225 [Alyxoria varia]|nr:MAG: hypothetical protein M1831_004225 [Alyxoria varia]